MEDHAISYIAALIGSVILTQYLRVLFFYKYTIKKWNITEGVIISNSIMPTDDDSQSWLNEILYEYEVNAKKYKSKTYTKNFRVGVPFKYQVSPDSRYKEGVSVTVSYDPKEPHHALLDAEFSNDNNLAVVLSVIAFFIAAYYW